MMLKRATLIILVLAFAVPMFAQKMSWRKHRKLADELYEKANYAEAAENYEAAWKRKNVKKNSFSKQVNPTISSKITAKLLLPTWK